MVDNLTMKPLGLVLIVTAHMVFNDAGSSKEEPTLTIGILGSSVTLTFIFSPPHVICETSHVAVYNSKETKIAERNSGSANSNIRTGHVNNSVLYHITNLTHNNSDTYWAILFSHGPTIERKLIKSRRVRLEVREEILNTTVPPTSTITTNSQNKSSISIFFLAVSPVVLLVAGLPCLIWCLVRTRDEQPPSENVSNPTLQETIDPISTSQPSVIYSVLDFPKRPSAVLEMNPNDTEYAAVTYLSEKRTMHS